MQCSVQQIPCSRRCWTSSGFLSFPWISQPHPSLSVTATEENWLKTWPLISSHTRNLCIEFKFLKNCLEKIKRGKCIYKYYIDINRYFQKFLTFVWYLIFRVCQLAFHSDMNTYSHTHVHPTYTNINPSDSFNVIYKEFTLITLANILKIRRGNVYYGRTN